MGSKQLAGVIVGVALACSSTLLAAPTLTAPAWKDLTVDQRRTLAPIAKEWDSLSDERKRKWAGIAERFPGYTPEEQSRVQGRMETWFSLTPEQRAVARDQYRNLQRMSPEQREALKQQWKTYQELPNEEKQRFNQAAQSTAKKVIIPKAGAQPFKPLTAPPPPRRTAKIAVKPVTPKDDAQSIAPSPSLVASDKTNNASTSVVTTIADVPATPSAKP